VRTADAHLTPQEFELVLFTAAVSTPTTADRAQVREAQQHLDGCEHCQSVARHYANVDSALARLRAGQGSVRKPDCPEETVWMELAAGLTEERAASGLLEHAAQCDYCGKLLREAAEDLAMEPSPEVERAVAALRTAQPDAQQALAAKLAKTGTGRDEPVSDRRRESAVRPEGRAGFTWWPRLAWAAAGIAVVVVAVLAGMRMFRQPDPNQLLAKAYTQKRTIELRFPGAEYGPIRVERGAGNKDQPTEFYEAEVIIKRESGKHAEDPNWLQAQARAALLQWDYESAIRDIEDALMLKPEDPALLQDKAMAYFERAEKLGPQGAIDYGEAAEDLSKALKKTPEDPVALFNRAIIYEKIHLPNEAIADLEHYLRVDPSGPWSAEAKERLDRLKKMVKAHDDALAEPLDDPATFLRHMGDPAAVAHIDERIEDYQDLAIKEWLPAAFPVTGRTSKSGEAFSALRALADILQERHKDKWLNDLLDESSNAPAFALAIAQLRDAFVASTVGDPSLATTSSREAENFFEQAGSGPGVLRAEIEEVRALQRAQSGDRCTDTGRRFEEKVLQSGYRWVKAQFAIDQSSCSMMLTRFNRAHSFIEKARSALHAGKYSSLALRATGISAAIATDSGDLVEAWRQDQDGLAEYWEIPPARALRGQQFYDDLTYSAENLGNSELALAYAEESARLISIVGDLKTEALARQHLAQIAMHDGYLSIAAAEMHHSLDLLSRLSSSEALENYKAYGEIGLAEAETRSGKLADAENRLERVAQRHFESFTIPRNLYRAHAMLMEKEGRADLAETELLNGVRIADASLNGMNATAGYLWIQENSSLYRSLIELQLARGQTDEAFLTWEWYKSAGYGSSALPVNSLQTLLSRHLIPELIQAQKNDTVLSYSLLPHGLAIWILDDNSLEAKIVPLDPEYLVSLSRYFVTLCADPDSDMGRLKARGRKLFDLLISPVQAKLAPDKTLVIESDEGLGDLPFEALFMNDGRYLGDAFRIVESPGLFNKAHLRPVSPISASTRSVFVSSMATVTLADGTTLTPASDADQEIDAIASRFRDPEVLKYDAATVSRVAHVIERAQLVHFAAHAVSDGKREGIVLWSSDGNGRRAELWGAKYIKNGLFGHTSLVVLSACATGRAVRGRQGIHDNLVRALSLAGVAQTVASRWDVNSASTTSFMIRFYRELLSGKSVPAALQGVARTLREQPDLGHPYYWAAFGAFGRG
jgi:CHAT domain-containing protein